MQPCDRLDHWQSRVHLHLGWALAFALVGCSQERRASTEPGVVRGERVVVEVQASEFVEGQVLTTDPQQVKVQTLQGEQLRVDRSALYRLSDAIQDPSALQYAICEWQPQVWHACQIDALQGPLLRVLNLAGEFKALEPARVLRPTRATWLSQERLFEQAKARGRFEAEARAAGKPRAPFGWRPAVGDAVLAQRGDDWLTARVRVAVDAGVGVAWGEQDNFERLRRSDVIPRPPHAGHLAVSAGSYALMAGPLGQSAWLRVRVETATETDAIVVDRNGVRSKVSLKNLVPLQR